MEFDSDFEEAILSQALRDVNYVKKAARVCESHHFGSAERAWVWGVIQGSWGKYHELVTPKLLLHKAREDFPDDDKREPYIKTVSKLLHLKSTAPESALEELEKFVRFVNAQLAAERVAEALEKGKIDDAYKAMSTAVRVQAGIRRYSLIHWIEEFEERQKKRKYEREHPEEIIAIPTGWKTIDGITDGVRLGELALILATTGRGKSIALNNIMYHAAGRGFNCLYIGFEMPARQIAARTDSRWLGVDYKDLKRFELAPTDLRAISARHGKAKDHYAGRIKIASFPVRSATIQDVRGLLDDLRGENEWKPHMILFDSADHLKATDTLKEGFRLQQAEVYWQVKGLAEDEGYAVWSATHANKEWAGMVATAEAAKESYDKSQIADLVASLNDPNAMRGHKKAKVETDDDEDGSDDEEFEVGEDIGKARPMDMFLAKYRDGESGRTIKMIADYHKMLLREADG